MVIFYFFEFFKLVLVLL